MTLIMVFKICTPNVVIITLRCFFLNALKNCIILVNDFNLTRLINDD